MNISDPKDLVILAKNGDTQAFGLLYEELFTPVFRYVYSKLNNREDAEDLTQTVFLKAFKSIGSFQDQNKNPLAYLFTIARNAIIDFQRKKRELQLESDEKEELLVRLVDQRENPEEKIIKKEQHGFIHSLLGMLKPEYKEVLMLKFLNDYSTSEIAEKMGKTEANIRQTQVRALQKLRVHLSLNS